MLVGVSCIYAVISCKNYGIMATVYKVEVVSHWINYTKEELQKILQEAIKKQIEAEGNEITFNVQERE